MTLKSLFIMIKCGGFDGAEEKLAAVEALKKSLELILKGKNPYDIFVRWKHIGKQPIEWNPFQMFMQL